MRLQLRLTINTMRLRTGRRTFYAALTVGPWTWWLQRWDARRCPDNGRNGRRLALSSDGVMTWHAGFRSLSSDAGERYVRVN